MNRNSIAPLRPMILFFVVLNGFFVAGRSLLDKWNADQAVLIAANLVLFVVTLVSFLLTKRSFNASNPHAFIRAIYTGFMVKFFVCIAAAYVYIVSSKTGVNKNALFVSLGLYLLYTFMEVSILTKLLKKKKNA